MKHNELALVVVLIIAMDRPFRGEVSISPTAFVRAQLAWRDLSTEPFKGRPGISVRYYKRPLR